MEYRFSDLVDILDIQQILVAFHAANGIMTRILDLDGRIIVSSSAQNLFEEFHPFMQNRWRGEEQILSQNNENLLRLYEYFGGLFQYAEAVRVEDRDIATLILGPVLHAPLNELAFHELVKESRFDGTASLASVKQVPIVTEEQAQSYVQFLIQALQHTAEKGLDLLNLKDALLLSQNREAQLESAYQELESRILDRTEELQKTNQALQESEQRFRVALVDTPIVVFNQDADLRYTWVYNLQGYADESIIGKTGFTRRDRQLNNRGYADESIIGKTDADLYSAEDAARLTALKRRVMAAGLLTREEVLVTVGSRTTYYDMTLDPLFDEAGAVIGITCAATDITERKRLYEQMQRRLAESESIQKIARGLLQKIGLDEVLKIVCVEAIRLTGATGSAVLLLEENGWLTVTHSEGVPEFPFNRLPVQESFAGRAFQTGNHVWVNIRESDPEEAAHALQGYPWIQGVTTLFIVPLRVETRVIGVINILDKPGDVTQDDERIIDLFADQAAIIIEHIRLQDQAEQLAILQERQRLARELHDSVTQALYSVTLYADAARMAFSAKKWRALETNLQEVRNMAREAMYDMRLLVFELRPFMLETEGLVSVLRARLAAVEDRAGLKTEILVDGERRLPIMIEEELYRIAQEGLNNVVRHAVAKHVRIHIRYDENSVSLEMIDDGLGFDLQTADQSGGFGLQGIMERVQRLGGSQEIESTPMEGTRLKVKVPIQ
jgi:signal transduction histidine kinase/PAS domain-containing protein